jgi:hypothetical protein
LQLLNTANPNEVAFSGVLSVPGCFLFIIHSLKYLDLVSQVDVFEQGVVSWDIVSLQMLHERCSALNHQIQTVFIVLVSNSLLQHFV